MSQSCQDQCCLFLRGDLLWRDATTCATTGDPEPFEKVGEIRSYTHTLDVTTIGKQKSYGLRGGYSCTAYTFDGLTVSFEVQCMKNSNMATAFFGETCDVAAGNVTVAEQFPASMVVDEAILPLKYIGVSNVVITSPSGAVLGVDYKITPAGIEILSGSALAGLDVSLTYSHKAQGRVEIGTKTSVTKELLFNGKDQDGNAVVIRLFKVEIAAEGEIQWLQDDQFMTFTVTGTAISADDAATTEWCAGTVPSTFGYIQRAA